MSRDKDYNELINTRRWQHLRRHALEMHPLCVECERAGRITAATEVHHRVPVQQGGNRDEKQRLMYSLSNLMPLCHACHVEIHRHMGRSGRVATRRLVNAHVDSFLSRYIDRDGGGDF